MKRLNISEGLPKISIIVTSYNKEKYIPHTLQSILDQKYPFLEIVVVEDGSRDASLKIVQSFVKKYPEIFKLFIQKNQGQIKATNLGLLKSTGEIVNFLNSDDNFDKDILLDVGKNFRDDPELLWLTGYAAIIDQNDKQIYPWVSMYKNFLLKLNKYFLLLIVNYITFSSVFIRRSAINGLGKFTNKRSVFLEYALWLKLGKLQMPKIIKKNLVHFRLTSGNLTLSIYKEVLEEDYLAAKRHTLNPLILLFHKVNNLSRILLIGDFNRFNK